jgi:hypothetical protein
MKDLTYDYFKVLRFGRELFDVWQMEPSRKFVCTCPDEDAAQKVIGAFAFYEEHKYEY